MTTTLGANTSLPTYDPVTLEVIRMRLDSIVEEMGIAMIRSSGSPVITEAGDFNTALFTPDGRIYSYSDYVQFHIGSGGVAVRNLVATIGDEQPQPGDAFICNDPHTSGSSHPPDTTVISPVFYKGELIAWAQSQAHLVDVGGMTPGGFAPAALDCYSEAVRIPPGVKVFEAGVPVESTKRLLLNNVRVPVLYWNDVRSLVASNNTGIQRMLEAIDEFGLDTFREYSELSFQLAEQVMRERIAKLPDGRWEAEEWTEHNGHDNDLYRVHCVMTKSDDQITFDFSDSSDQTGGFVNCSYGALLGSLASAIVPILAWNVPFNEGVVAAFDVKTRRGSIVDPVPPAPISNGHLTTGARVSRVVTKLLNESCRLSEDEIIRNRTQGVWADSWTGGISAGNTDDGHYTVLFNMDGGAVGAGAQPESDGLDCAGMMTQVNNMLPDVEMNEMLYPVHYLWKRLSLSSGGHGRTRGGLGAEFAWTLRGANEVVQTVFSPTAQVPADGFGGGLPGGGSGHEIWRSTNANSLIDEGMVPTDANLVAGEQQLLDINHTGLTVHQGDVFVQWCAGGGGYGDPLLRSAATVAQDVRDRYITAAAAQDVYGVSLDTDGNVDETATSTRRAQMRAARIGATPSRSVSDDLVSGPVSPARNGSFWECPSCNGNLGSEESWRDECHARTSIAAESMEALGVRIRHRKNEIGTVHLEELYCPHCGTQLDARIKVEGVTQPKNGD
ncbi:hydantoinase B/oxoprolinase family protein (plasmid) [Rhodococcus pseudokoreensis]|uniref:Hydantoinase B/oxoprolinase family protein n=1 Tax=Rhodococcus pseudokoreensis TaxID=2811421 RepID=A0A974VYZ3_9NOCA|nr:hydantoinase B/oxoprolinase family protein [Rhodococcus pseudokoreensis]QSE87318.1 hydantoinase B/oxoprolinase family protein [Rhodococcus pseudokoreensis]